jgi:hypothetical protein
VITRRAAASARQKLARHGVHKLCFLPVQSVNSAAGLQCLQRLQYLRAPLLSAAASYMYTHM